MLTNIPYGLEQTDSTEIGQFVHEYVGYVFNIPEVGCELIYAVFNKNMFCIDKLTKTDILTATK